MSVLLEILVKNAKGLAPEIRSQLDQTFGQSFLPDHTEIGHRNWSSTGYDIDVAQDAAVMSNRKRWWDFCSDPSIRHKCLEDAYKLAKLLGSDEIFYVPETAHIAVSAMEGRSWEELVSYVERDVPSRATDFRAFEVENALEKEDDPFPDEFYFRFLTDEVATMLNLAG